MKLKFLKPYPNSSITKRFDDIEINDFTIITGKNGVGKTHLLEAIVDNNNYIDIDSGVNAIYFNYNDFIVESKRTHQNQSTLKKKNSNLNKINQDLSNMSTMISTKIESPLIYTHFKERSNLTSQVYYYFMDNISFINIPIWEDIRENLLNISNDEEFLKNVYDKFIELVEKFLEQNKDKVLKYIKKAESLKIPLKQLNVEHFQYQESWLGELLEIEFKKYIKLYDKTKKDIEYNAPESITIREIKEKTIKKVGYAPWSLLNNILKTYSCNDYVIDEDLVNTLESFENLDNQPLNIKLKNYTTGQTVNLDRLSSGEKTLFALAVTLYRQKTDENLPTILLLDEIDSSLHPSMCKQLLSVLKNIFVDEYGLKIIMVTHSPSTVALAPENLVYIMENNNGKISLERNNKQKAISFLSDGFATFNEGLSFLDSILDSNKKISILTEGDNVSYIENAIRLLDFNLLESVEIVKNIEGVTGDSQLRTLFDIFSKLNHKQIILFIWDCDCYKKYANKLEEINNTIPFIFEQNSENNIAEKGIENLFIEDLFEGFYSEIKKSDGTVSKKFESNKKKEFLNFIKNRKNKDDFKNFKSLIDELKMLNE